MKVLYSLEREGDSQVFKVYHQEEGREYRHRIATSTNGWSIYTATNPELHCYTNTVYILGNSDSSYRTHYDASIKDLMCSSLALEELNAGII